MTDQNNTAWLAAQEQAAVRRVYAMEAIREIVDGETLCRPSELAPSTDEARKAADVMERMDKALQDAQEGLKAERDKFAAAQEAYVIAGATGPLPKRAALDRAESQVSDAQQRYDLATEHATRKAKEAKAVADQYREGWVRDIRDVAEDRYQVALEAFRTAGAAFDEYYAACASAARVGDYQIPGKQNMNLPPAKLYQPHARGGASQGLVPVSDQTYGRFRQILADSQGRIFAMQLAQDPETGLFREQVIDSLTGPRFVEEPRPALNDKDWKLGEAPQPEPREPIAGSDTEYFEREASR